MNDFVYFEVRGMPQPKGSMRGFAFFDKKLGKYRAAVTAGNNAKGTKEWAADVRCAAKANAPKEGPWDGPISLKLVFTLQPPKSLPKTKVSYAIKKPDADKLVRNVQDALTKVIYRDDAQVVEMWVVKRYGGIPRVEVTVGKVNDANNLGWLPARDA